MRKAILMLLLAVVSGSAAAEWVLIGNTAGVDGFYIYADPATVRRSANLAKIWIMYDYKSARAVGLVRVLSEKYQYEVDCKDKQARQISFTAHPLARGEANPVRKDDDPTKWAPVAPGSVQEISFNIACGKR